MAAEIPAGTTDLAVEARRALLEQSRIAVSATPESQEDKMGRRARIAERVGLPKFGDLKGTTGIERGITEQSPVELPITWAGEEKEKKEKAQKKQSKQIAKPPKKAYRPPSQRNTQFNYEQAQKQEQRAKASMTHSDKAQKLLAYCQGLIPPEGSGGKKKKKKKIKYSHSMEYVSMFLEIGVKPPKHSKEINKTIAALEAKMAPEN